MAACDCRAATASGPLLHVDTSADIVQALKPHLPLVVLIDAAAGPSGGAGQGPGHGIEQGRGADGVLRVAGLTLPALGIFGREIESAGYEHRPR